MRPAFFFCKAEEWIGGDAIGEAEMTADQANRRRYDGDSTPSRFALVGA
jgi:hypothetical protein